MENNKMRLLNHAPFPVPSPGNCTKKHFSRVVTLHDDLRRGFGLICPYFGRSVLTEPYYQKNERQDFLSLEYIQEGSLDFCSGDFCYAAEPGDLCLLHPDQTHTFRFRKGAPACRKCGAIFSGPLLRGILDLLDLRGVNVICPHDRARWETAFSRLEQAMSAAATPADAEHLSGLAFVFLQNVAAEARGERRNDVSPALAAVRAELFARLGEPISMPDLARRHGFSLPVFNREFRRAFHETPYQCLIRLRLTRAADLLRSDAGSIKEIAARCGYGDPLYFSNGFKRRFGLSPRLYRMEKTAFMP